MPSFKMDLLDYLSNFQTFKACIRGSLNSVSGWYRSWFSPDFSTVIYNAKLQYLQELEALIEGDTVWVPALAYDNIDFLTEKVSEWLDPSTNGRLVAACAFISFILDKWSEASPLSLDSKIERLCAGAWLRIISVHSRRKMLRDLQP